MALPADFSKIFGSTATGGLTPISDINYAKGWEYLGANPPEKNDFSYVQNLSDLKAQWLYSNKLQRTNPFGDIKSDGAGAVSTALANLGLDHFGYEPSTGETAIFNGNKNLRYFINNNNESGVASVDYGLLWGFDDTGRLIKGVIPVARLDGLSSGTGTSTTAVMSQKATTDAINTAKTTIVQQFGQSTTSVISQKGTTDLVNDAASVGVNQLWTDVTATRAVGVNYTNNTGRPIVIAMNVTNVAINTLASSLVVQGILMTTGSPASGEHRYISAIVPPGQTYKFTPVATSGFTLWELRA